jgi:hypothetical protein
LSCAGERLAAGPVTPTPWRAADTVPPAALVARVKVPEAGPLEAAVNLTETEQFAPAARGEAQVFALMAKGAEIVGAAKVRGPLPAFVSVRVCAALVAADTTGPKLRSAGASVGAGIVAPFPRKLTVNDGVPGASVLIVSVPVRAPEAVGEKVTV